MSIPTLPPDADDLAALLERVPDEIIVSKIFWYPGPDDLTDTLIDALDLPDTVIVVQTRLE